MEGNGFTTEDVVACAMWSRDVQLPVPPSHVVKKGFGEILEYLSGSFHDISTMFVECCACVWVAETLYRLQELLHLR